jgi:AraC family transcriptional activator of pobA
MNKRDLENITIPTVKAVYKGSYIEDDMVIFNEVNDVPLPNEPKRMSCLFVALCIKGKVQYSVDTVNHVIGSGDLIMIFSGQVVDDYLFSRDCSGIAIMVSDDFFQEMVSNVHELSSLFIFSRSHPVSHLSAKQVENVQRYFTLLKSRVDDPDNHFRRDVARSLMQSLIYELSNIIWLTHESTGGLHSRSDKIFTQFIKLVEAHYKDHRRVGWYAYELGITPKYLSETVKQVSCRTPNEWIDSYVTMELRVQLRNTTKSVKEIAEQMHFPNQSFLGKYFKEHVGMSPSDYRRGKSIAKG